MTSSANKLQTLPTNGFDASITQLIDENTAEDVPVTEFSINLTLHITAAVDRGLSGQIEKTSNILYAHFGGQPALNAYSALFAT